MEINLILPQEFISKKTGVAGGNSQGYMTAADLTKKSLSLVGATFSETARIYIYYTSPHFFIPAKEKINVLFTMWEAENLPQDMCDYIRQADYIIVPSKNSKDAIKRAGLSNTVYVCHQGVDTEFFYYRARRQFFGDKIRYLWVGAPNIRKGYDLAVRAFHKAFYSKVKDVELYIKSSLYGKSGKITHLPQYNAVIDTRNVSREEMRELYWSASVFFYPSRGEGAGLPPLEAMSTGLPVIAPAYSGMKDYMKSEYSYPVPYTLVEADYGVQTKVCEADEGGLIEILCYTYNNLKKAARVGLNASVFVGDMFSLERMGHRLYYILQKIMKEEE